MSERITRRGILYGSSAAFASALLWGRQGLAFGEEGAFHARLLELKKADHQLELSATRRWALELTRRTSAPGKLATYSVAANASELLKEPFLVWAGTEDPGALSVRAVRSLREYLRMGGILLVDDRDPARPDDKSSGAFGRGARREVARILPESSPIPLEPSHVLFKTFYILPGPQGRRLGPEQMDAIVSGKQLQVLFLQHDLLGALARRGETWAFPMERGDAEAREWAIRFAVNIAMYVLCSDYKDDQVHAPYLMRRRHGAR